MGRRRKRTNGNDRTGGIAVWKPVGPTSRVIVDEVQQKLGIGPLGHTGTLDPLASGVIVLVGGHARKFQELLMKQPKEYVAAIELGTCSGSDDAEGPLWCPVPKSGTRTIEEVRDALVDFEGGYDQVPPQMSAVRLEGKRAYQLARQGESPELKSRPVTIHGIDILGYESPMLDIHVRCGSGTYLRSIARDLGDRLEVGGYLKGLQRTESSGHSRASVVELDDVTEECWLPLEKLLVNLPRIDIDSEEDTHKLSTGQRVRYPRRTTPFEGRGIAWCQGRVAGIVDVFHSMIEPRRWILHHLTS